MNLIKIRGDLEKICNLGYGTLKDILKTLNIPIIQKENGRRYPSLYIKEDDLKRVEEFCKKPKSERYSILLRLRAKEKYGSYESFVQLKKQHQEETLSKNLGCKPNEVWDKILKKGRQSFKDKTGLENPFQDVENMKKAYKEKLGVENPRQLNSVKEKAKQTCIERYGVENPNQNKNIRERSKQTMLKRYGGLGSQSAIIKNKVNETRLRNLQNFCEKNNYIEAKTLGDPFLVRFLCDQNHIFYKKKNQYGTFLGEKDKKIVLNLLKNFVPFKNSKPQYELLADIQQFYKGDIRVNDRTVIHPLEIDIYIPEKKLGIEFDGIYWHSEQGSNRAGIPFDKNRHLEKTKICEKRGIRLLHIFEDEYIFKKDKILSIIKDALGLNNRIYARKCNFQEISTKECNTFLDEYHLDGGSKSISKSFGLFYNNELLEVIGFGKNRFSKDKNIELIRSATKDGYNVIGGLSKLVKDSKISHFITFADRRLFFGNSYLKCGCQKLGETKPSYFYVKEGSLTRENRLKYQKHKLQNILENFDPKKSEHENMLMNHYYRIYDCGTFKFEYNGENK